MFKRSIPFSLLFAFLSGGLMAQIDSSQVSSKLIRDKNILALPVVFRLPETGWAAGAIATASWSWAKDSMGANPSQGSFGLTYTQNKQILIFLPFKVFINNNSVLNDSRI